MNCYRPTRAAALLVAVLGLISGCAASSAEEADSDWFLDVCAALENYNDSLFSFLDRSKEISADYDTFIDSDPEELMAPLADDAEELKAVMVAVRPSVPEDDRPFYDWLADLVFKAVDGARRFVEVLTSNSYTLDEIETTTAEMVSTLIGPASSPISEIPDEVSPDSAESMASTRAETIEAANSCGAFNRPYEGDPMDVFPLSTHAVPVGPGVFEPWTSVVRGSPDRTIDRETPILTAIDLVGEGWEFAHEEGQGDLEGPLDPVVEMLSGVCETLVGSSDPPVTVDPEPVHWQMTHIERPSVDPGALILAVEEYSDEQQAGDAFRVVEQAMGCMTVLGMEAPPWDISLVPEADLFALRGDNTGAASLPQLPGLDAYDAAPAGVSDIVWLRRERWVVAIVSDPYGIANGAAPEIAELLAGRITDGD